MSPRANAALSGLIAAAVAAFLFWGINSTHQVDGVGLLRRSVWPFSSLGIWMALGAVVGTIGSAVRAARRIAHTLDTEELAEERGDDYAESFALPPGASSMPVFAGWSEGRNAMSASAGDFALTVFDYTTISRGGDSHEVANGTVALLPLDGLPSFDLRPRTFGRRFLGWAGFEGLTFDPSASNRVDAETVRRFAELFHLSAVDPLTLAIDVGPVRYKQVLKKLIAAEQA